MKNYYVYILRCNDGTYYTGITSDISKRLFQHERDDSLHSYVSRRKPFELVFIDIFDNPLSAISREKQIKKWSQMKKEALINSNWEKLKQLSECSNDTHFLISSYAKKN
ncbi:MAG: GIY-YIG nuclease family protein [Spirochaetes bacterium]|nr:GIY-YIG nuclease family protein [Spirochaetota bacterium]